jgi:hypothetical protein
MLTFKNNTISAKNKVAILIEAYKQLLNVPPPTAILECSSFYIECHGETSIKVEPWWPQKTGKIKISDHGDKATISLSGIHKVVKRCKEIVLPFHFKLTGGVLGLLKIQELSSVDISTEQSKETLKALKKANVDVPDWTLGGIIEKYLPEGNIIECQAELINIGFEEYATL